MPEFTLTSIDLLRILCGIWFIPHLIGKVRNFEKATKTFEAAGLKPGKPFLVLTVALEFVAAVGMVFDIYPRWLRRAAGRPAGGGLCGGRGSTARAGAGS